MTAVFLAIILAIGSFFRLANLTSLPISLFGDEIDVGYQSWSLITTGRDYMGNLLPTYIHSLSEWRAPLLMYITAPFVGILGPTDLAVRLPVALLGIASIYLLFLLVKLLFKNEKIALASALVLALTPWHIHYSRAAFEVVPLVFLLLLGTYLFVKEKYFASLIPFILTFYTYSTANIFTPLYLLGLLIITRPSLKLKQNWARLIFPVILALPVVFNVLFGEAGGRFGIVSIFHDQKVIDQLIINRTESWVTPSPVETFFHNKYFAYATEFGKNYLTAFSPEFLFLKGDPYYRHSISEQGELLWLFLPFFVYGLFVVAKKLSQSSNKILLLWLFLSPIPSSLTQNGGTHATRLFLMIPPLVIITAIGFIDLFSRLRLKIIALLVAGVLLTLAFTNYWHVYSAHYRFASASLWQYGYENIFKDLGKIDSQYDHIYINSTFQPSLLRFAFYTQYPPEKFIKNFKTDVVDSYRTSYYHGFQFADKYYFGEATNLDELKGFITDKDLLFAVQGKEGQGDWDWAKNPLENTKTLFSQKDVLGQPLFYIITGTRSTPANAANKL